VAIGASGIMVSNHGGRQLDGSRSAFDQLSEIVDAVGDKIDVILDGGIRRGTHVVKALAAGAKACSGGRMYLYALAAAGQPGVEKALGNMRTEIERDMKLIGVKSVSQLSRICCASDPHICESTAADALSRAEREESAAGPAQAVLRYS
jgi:L-lactate dehydrogenase (cytochrome)